MVHLPTLEAMRKSYRENLQQWVKEHPGEYVLIDGFLGNKITFYKSLKELNKSTAKYQGRCGPTFLVEKIPIKTHRFNEGNKTLDFSKDFRKFCPNDNKTRLLQRGKMLCYDGEKEILKGESYCPNCECTVFREKEIKKPIRDLANRVTNFLREYSHRYQF